MIKILRSIVLMALVSALAIGCASQGNINILEDGKPSPNKDNVKTVNGFKAQLWLIDDPNFFTRWNWVPTKGVKLNPISEVQRNKVFFAIIIFSNPGANLNNRCDISCDIAVKTPSGKVYGEIKDAECWRDKPAPTKDMLGLGVAYLGIKIEDADPSGRWTVDAIVNDKIKSTTLSLTQHFNVE